MEQPGMRKRAVHSDQKEERRREILVHTWRLFQERSYESITMAEVAEASGLAKGTVFLYFKTREALFLTLLEQQLAGWFSVVNESLRKMADSATISAVVTLFCEQLELRPGLTRLLAILHTVLERNIQPEEARHFKFFLKEHFESTGGLLEQTLSFLQPGQGAHLLLQCDALVIGLWQLSDPSPIVQQVLQEPELHLFQLRFATELASAMHALFSGLESAAQMTT